MVQLLNSWHADEPTFKFNGCQQQTSWQLLWGSFHGQPVQLCTPGVDLGAQREEPEGAQL